MRPCRSRCTGRRPTGNERLQSRLLSITTIFVVLELDARTKSWAEQSLMHGVPVPIVDTMLQWRLGYNRGVAFGMFANGEGIWPALIGLTVIGIGAWFIRLLTVATPPFAVFPLACILGGAIANLADRWPDGQVTDFLDLGIGTARWPAFNLADAAISFGVAALIVASLREDGLARAHGSRHQVNSPSG